MAQLDEFTYVDAVEAQKLKEGHGGNPCGVMKMNVEVE